MKPELAGKNLQLTPFRSEEDDSEYSVWKVTFDDQTLALKEAKEYEEQVYREFLADPLGAAPKLCATARDGEKTFLLMEYIPGETLSKCTRPALIRAGRCAAQKDFRRLSDRRGPPGALRQKEGGEMNAADTGYPSGAQQKGSAAY